MKRMIGLLLALLLLVPVCALAELRRGDSGEEVTALQQMLWDTGFIFEEPDGVFGRNTEKAVKWFQEYANLEQSGIVDDRTLDSLYACWLRIMDENDAYMYLPDDEPELQPNSFREIACIWNNGTTQLYMNEYVLNRESRARVCTHIRAYKEISYLLFTESPKRPANRGYFREQGSERSANRTGWQREADHRYARARD